LKPKELLLQLFCLLIRIHVDSLKNRYSKDFKNIFEDHCK
jgi:hypothetical protein